MLIIITLLKKIKWKFRPVRVISSGVPTKRRETRFLFHTPNPPNLPPEIKEILLRKSKWRTYSQYIIVPSRSRTYTLRLNRMLYRWAFGTQVKGPNRSRNDLGVQENETNLDFLYQKSIYILGGRNVECKSELISV